MTNTGGERRIHTEQNISESCAPDRVVDGVTNVCERVKCEAEFAPGCCRTADDDRRDASQEW